MRIVNEPSVDNGATMLTFSTGRKQLFNGVSEKLIKSNSWQWWQENKLTFYNQKVLQLFLYEDRKLWLKNWFFS